MISSEVNPAKREEYVQRLMEPPNSTWNQIMMQAKAQGSECLKPQEIKNIANILKTNTSCTSLGQPFQNQMSNIYADVLNVYKLYSELISASIAEGGPYASRTSLVKAMRTVKPAEVLRLIETFVERCEDPHLVAQQLVPPMMDPVLGDYARNVPDARDAEVLSLHAAIINKVEGAMIDEVPKIFGSVFECTLQMITANFEDHPDHRLKFFALLRYHQPLLPRPFHPPAGPAQACGGFHRVGLQAHRAQHRGDWAQPPAGDDEVLPDVGAATSSTSLSTSPWCRRSSR